MAIHPTAIVDPKANIADDVEIGAYSIIGRMYPSTAVPGWVRTW
jgi:acyl-[acyl carrier protein]--UDP-N-acetylglucosamine O-acyltransferase